MKTVLVPTFDEFNKYAFIGYKEVKVKNKPTYKDLNKIETLLPGCPQGSSPLPDNLNNGWSVDVRRFYDIRQNTKKLKGYKVFVKN